jgi:hypothetical protein
MRAFCCCSAGRPKLIRQTLKALIRACLPPTILHVVVPYDEEKTYRKSLQNYTFVTVIGADRGFDNQKTAFRSYVPETTEIVFIDDVISDCPGQSGQSVGWFKRVDLLGSNNSLKPLYFCKNDPRLKEEDNSDCLCRLRSEFVIDFI